MNEGTPSAQTAEYRDRARRLLKQLRKDDPDRAAAAAQRFLCLHTFSELQVDELLRDRDRVRLKHALVVVAREHGHDSWLQLKQHAESAGGSAPANPRPGSDSTPMYVTGFDVLLNSWFARYDDAREALERNGGYLLPYRNQFLICESDGIRLLGLDPEDEDWERIGRDWQRPADLDAWRRLRERRLRVMQKREAAN